MDTLGALALATEPPNDDLMKRSPVGRKGNFISNVMWRNILGQSLYQFVIIWFLQTRGKAAFHLDGPDSDLILNTIIFNSFVCCQVIVNSLGRFTLIWNDPNNFCFDSIKLPVIPKQKFGITNNHRENTLKFFYFFFSPNSTTCTHAHIYILYFLTTNIFQSTACVGTKPTWAVLPPEKHLPTTERRIQPKQKEWKTKTTNKWPKSKP